MRTAVYMMLGVATLCSLLGALAWWDERRAK